MAAGAAVIRVAAQLRRGRALRLHTGHEMLDTVGLVHMNGRVYDPTLGRFLSADPFIQAPAATLSYHRYAYVMNNPLVLTDPSGYSWLSKTWKKLWRNEVFRIGLSFAAAWYGGQFIMGQLFEGALAAPRFSSAFAELATTGGTTSMQLTTLGSVTVGASGGFAGSLVGSGGDMKSAAQGALTGGLMGWAGTVGGAGTAGAESAARYAAHATAGCIGGAVDGSGCGRGAAAAVVGKFATNKAEGIHPAGQFAISVVAGGTASVITGGKFENGARTAAFGYLFNHCSEVPGGCWRALKEAASMATDWALGNGAAARVFGPGSIQVTDMMDAPGVNAARDLFYEKNAAALASGSYGELDPVTNYRAKFGLYHYLTTSSPTQQFVGSYRVDVFTVNQGADLMFVVNNNSSFTSFGYGVAPSWERSSFSPGGNMRQTYWWTEPRR